MRPIAVLTLLVLFATACGGGNGVDDPGTPDPLTGRRYGRQTGGTSTDEWHAVSSFADGSFVVVGDFRDTVTFGAGEPAQTQLTSDGFNDICVARYNPDGTLTWARRAGSTSSDSAWGVATVPDGTCIVAGLYSDGAVFGPGEGNQTTLSDVGGSAMFVARYAADGSLLWARSANGAGTQRANAVAAFADGSSAVTGSFSQGATFAPGEGNQTVFVAAGNMDIFSARYNPDGTMDWVRHVAGTTFEAGRGIATFDDGSCVVTGEFSGNVTFGPGDPNQTTLADAGDGDAFIARYQPTGVLDWAKRAGGADDEEGKAITALPGGDCVVTGFYEGTATFGPGEPLQTVMTVVGLSDAFVARYDAAGALVWARSAGGVEDEEGRAIARLSDGSVVVCGRMYDTATFGAGEPNATILPHVDSADAFLARYLPDGTLAWARAAGGPDGDFAAGVAGLPYDASVVVGEFLTTLTFDAGGPNELTLTAAGAQDGFIATYDVDGGF
jgi:hypothetical protein